MWGDGLANLPELSAQHVVDEIRIDGQKLAFFVSAPKLQSAGFIFWDAQQKMLFGLCAAALEAQIQVLIAILASREQGFV